MDSIDIKENIARLRREIYETAVKSGRDPGQITVIAVTKNVDVERIKEAIKEGFTDIGENRVQEMVAKQPLIDSKVNWHFIGHLQKNKVKYVVGKVQLIHSLDSWRLATEISRLSEKRGVVSDVLVQVNVSGEKSKYGLSCQEVPDFIKACSELPGLSIRGLMTIAPMVDNPEEARPVFKKLKTIKESLGKQMPFIPLDYLSMGMTNDYKIAIEEGANYLRIGTAIFGARSN